VRKLDILNSRKVGAPSARGSGYHRKRQKRSVISASAIIFAFGAGISGFQLLLLGIHLGGIGHVSRSLTVPFHAVFLGLSVLYVFYAVSKKSLVGLGWLWIPFLVFWLLYFARIALDGYFEPVPLVKPAVEYFQKAFGTVFVPMFLFLNFLDGRDNRLAFRAFWTIQIACLLLSMIFYGRFIEETYRSLRYFGVDTSMLLSPILLSYIGIVASVVSFQLLLKHPFVKRIGNSVFIASILVLGIILMFQGGTRSALITIVAASIIIGYSSLSTVSMRRAVSVIIIILIVGAVFYPMIRSVESGMIVRFSILREQLAFGDPLAGGGRLSIYRQAVKQFLDSPFIGSGLEVQEAMAAAHNSVLEAFLATGVVGGISFVVLVYVTTLRCITILRHHKSYGWMACLFLVFLIRSQFSYSIIDPGLWFAMFAVLAVRTKPAGKYVQANHNSWKISPP